ncbi:MAG: Ig-like domain-containing protein [Methanobacteriota archaeon]
MSGHFDNKRMWNKKGVSEVVGTLLILAITVVLFSGVIFMVGNIPTPTASVNTSLEGTLEEVSPGDWTQGAYVNVTNKGGIVLMGTWTDIVLIIGDTSSSHRTTPGIDGDGDEDWETGETWHYTIGAGVIDASSRVSVLIVAEDRSAIVWQADLKPTGARNYPPVIMSASVTSRFDDLDHNFIQYGAEFTISVRVVDFDGNLNPSTVWADMTYFGAGEVHLSDPDQDGTFTGTATGPYDSALYQRGMHPATFNATDIDGAHSSKVVYLPLGGDFTGQSELAIVQRPTGPPGWYNDTNITFGYGSLVHNKKAEITATIYNWGAEGAMISVVFWDNTTEANFRSNPKNIIDNISFVQVPPNGGSTDVTAHDWIPAYGGEHRLVVELIPDPGVPDEDLTNHEANITVTVQPTILVVDDDGYPNDKTDQDTSSFMRAALSAGNFDYDFTSVAVGDGPGYSTGDFKMVNYDVVVWMTGYSTRNTLTSNDVTNLKRFLGVGLNPGSLWLIGQGILADTANPGINAFLQSNLSIGGGAINRTSMATYLTCGSPSDNVTGYLNGGGIDIVTRKTGFTNGWAINKGADPRSFNSLVNTSTGDCYGVGFDINNNTRTYFTPWAFSRIKDTSDQAQLAYQVIRWLGNINTSFGRDLAISEQTIDKDVVYYRQPVQISGIVRNNGMQLETSSVRLTIYYNGMPLNDQGIIPDIQITVSNTIGSNWISVGPFVWTPVLVGYHTIVLEVDPDKLITETNENNNVVSNYLASGTINVQFRILVVDDDETDIAPGNETTAIRNALTRLGHFNESWSVLPGQPGPIFDYMKDFNVVIWSTGNAANPLLPADTTNLGAYLNNSGCLWLVGRNCLNTGASVFQQNYLGVASAAAVVAPASLAGVDGHNITHGTSYRLKAGTSQAIFPTFLARGMFPYNGSWFNAVNISTGGFKSVTTSFSFQDLNGSSEFPGNANASAELAQMVLRWFGLPELRVELRTALTDFFIDGVKVASGAAVNPQLGDSYVLQAKVQNTGGTSGNALVRFMDGTTQIGSDSITVSPAGFTTAEVIWTPLFAGQRTLYVLVDPINETGEIIEWFNNLISYPTYVYFFYDDMENGESKWNHDSTVTLINGEQPLDYISGTVVSMNIEKDWDRALVNPLTGLPYTNVTNSTDAGFYHTFDKSYWLQEPAGSTTTTTTTRVPMDVAIVIDSSGSMSGTDFTNARNAAKDFIAKLGSTDRCTLYNFQTTDGDPTYNQARTFAWMVQANRTSFNTTIDNAAFFTNTYTPIWDTIGFSLNYVKNNPRATGTAGSDYVQVLVALTDGDDYGPDDGWGGDNNEEGSEYYCPGSEVGSLWSTSSWGRAAGLKWGDTTVRYDNVDGTNGHDVYRYRAGAYAWSDINTADSGNGEPDNPDVYDVTTNVAGQSRTGLIYAPAIVYTVGLGVNPHSPTMTEAWAPFTTEYDLWKIANTSVQKGIHGQYFYEAASSNLSTIFQFIFSQISTQLSGQNITRSGNPPPGTQGVSGPQPGTRAFPGPAPLATVTETRYMRGVNLEANVNGLTAYSLGTTQSGTQAGPGSMGDGGTVYAGIRVYQRSSGGAETQITGAVSAIASVTANGAGIYSATWTPPSTGLASTDSIVVRVYADRNTNPPATLRATFTTEQLGASQLDNNMWTVRYYLIANSAGAGNDRIYWGITPYDTRIEGFRWTRPNLPPNAPSNPSPADGTVNVATTSALSWTCSDPDGDPLTYDVYLGTTNPPTVLVANDIAATTTSPALAASTLYYWYVIANDGSATTNGPVWAFATAVPSVGTYITYTYPSNGATGIAINAAVSVAFSVPMNIATVTYTCAPSPGGWAVSWSSGDTVATYTHANFDYAMLYTFTITGGSSKAGVPLSGGTSITLHATDFEAGWDGWSHGGTQDEWERGDPSDPGIAPHSGSNCLELDLNNNYDDDANNWLEQSFNLAGSSSTVMTFWNYFEFENNYDGGCVMVSNDGGTTWNLAAPNLPSQGWDASIDGNGDYNTKHGQSQGWTGDWGVWQQDTVDLSAYDGQSIIIRFWMSSDGSGNDDGWAIDDISIGGYSAAPNPFHFTTASGPTAPSIVYVSPSNGATGVGITTSIGIVFSKAMSTGTVAYTVNPNPGGLANAWTSGNTALTIAHTAFAYSTTYTVTVTAGSDSADGLPLTGTPYSWTFTTGAASSGGGGTGSSIPGLSPAGPNSNKSAVTKGMNLTNLETATLSFWHKYNMVPGVNGGVLMVGYKESAVGAWKWRYVVPSSAYTGNLRLFNGADAANVTARALRSDSMGTFMQWGWNGVSGRGTFAWEKVSVDLLPWVNQTGIAGYNPLSNVRVRFQYYQYGGGTGYGWYIDDVKVAVARGNAENVTADAWRLVTSGWAYGPGGTMLHTAHSGTYAWWNGDSATGYMKKGIDNSLMCGPIDLTNARSATLSAYFKFNINTADGAPPDGFRVEISKDNGLSWSAINLGVRAAWNVSGVEGDLSDGKDDTPDRSYSGIDSGNYWVSASSLTRLNVDLSSFGGNAIMLRFRMVTNSVAGYYAYKSNTVGFGGFYVDDVQVRGNTILG